MGVITTIGGAGVVLGVATMTIVVAVVAAGRFIKVGTLTRIASPIMLVGSASRIILFIVVMTTGITWSATVRIRTAIGGARKGRCRHLWYCPLYLIFMPPYARLVEFLNMHLT